MKKEPNRWAILVASTAILSTDWKETRDFNPEMNSNLFCFLLHMVML